MYTCVTTGCEDATLDVRKGNSDQSGWSVICNQHLLKSSNMPETLTSFMYIMFTYSSVKWIICSSPHWVEHTASWGGGGNGAGSGVTEPVTVSTKYINARNAFQGGNCRNGWRPWYFVSGWCKQRPALGFTFIPWVLGSSGRSMRKWVKYNPRVWKKIWQNEHARDKGRN